METSVTDPQAAVEDEEPKGRGGEEEGRGHLQFIHTITMYLYY
jgi:hypothetical protein